MRKILCAGVFIFLATALPARASSITIDSTNCTSDKGCYGLAWTLSVDQLALPTLFNGVVYTYEAKLEVTDDAAVTGTPSVVISGVDFKVSSGISAAALISAPASSSGWTTTINVLTANGCGTNPNPGFVCSQTASNPADFVASNVAQTWRWYFNTSSPIFTDMIGAHVGAKMTDLSTSGKLLSAYYVPEPGTLGLLATGIAALIGARARRRS